jgi:hypothetical protein
MSLLLALIFALGQVGSVAVGGVSTWYCGPSSACTHGYGPNDAVAAIDPGLGIPKGTVLTVTGDAGTRRVTVVDVCACSGVRIIDLTSGMFRAIVGPLSRGTGRVTIEWGGPAVPLPATDTAPDAAYWFSVVR